MHPRGASHPTGRVTIFRTVKVYLFNSSRDRTVFGFTADRTGANLPTAFAPWYSVNSRKMYPGTSIAGFASTDAVLVAIETDGFYLVRSAGGINSAMSAPKD